MGGRGDHPARRARTAAPPGRPFVDRLEGLQHVWHTPRLRAAMSLASLVNLCAFPLSGGLMPYIARDVFGLDQQGLGSLVASFATGALLGSLGMSAFGAQLRPARTMLVACVAWYLCLLGLALPIGPAVAMVLYVAAGLSQSLSMVALSIILLRTSHERFRGREGARMLAIYMRPIGLRRRGRCRGHGISRAGGPQRRPRADLGGRNRARLGTTTTRCRPVHPPMHCNDSGRVTGSADVPGSGVGPQVRGKPRRVEPVGRNP